MFAHFVIPNENLIGVSPMLTGDHLWLDVTIIYIIKSEDARNPAEAGIYLFGLQNPKSKKNIPADLGQL